MQPRCIVHAAVHPDMVQHFRARIITPSRVLLEWKPPSRPGVTKYKVSALFAHSFRAVGEDRLKTAGPENSGPESEGPGCTVWKVTDHTRQRQRDV